MAEKLTMCEIEVDNKESSYLKYRDCKYKAKYKVYYKFKESSEHKNTGTKAVCERHKKIMEQQTFVIYIENINGRKNK